MAKQQGIKFPVSQYKLATAIEKYMTTRAQQRQASPYKSVKDIIEYQLIGMEQMGRQIGIDCTCWFTDRGKFADDTCACRNLTAAERRRYPSLGSRRRR